MIEDDDGWLQQQQLQEYLEWFETYGKRNAENMQKMRGNEAVFGDENGQEER